ncbi:MAG: DUF523 and DUF1722 domain-containing protein [Anaerolineae bacterium]|nr:DUF523 and DUF1722 domain-containing protein [Anaerolineae bacterium]
MTEQKSEPHIRLGISACLLGQKVRYDGGHKLDHFLADELGRYVEWVPVCPEVECGLPIPREAMRLVDNPEAPRLVTIKTGIDLTEQMTVWAKQRVEQLADKRLHGFVFKKDSPSSGLFRVRVYNEHGMAERVGVGMFAGQVARRFPLLPLEEEGRLNDARLRENFIDRIFTYQRWRSTLANHPTPGGMVSFHTAHKMTLLAHSPAHYRTLGRLVAQIGQRPLDEIVDEYGALLMEGLKAIATPGRQFNTMQHLMGFLKDSLDAHDKEELLEQMHDYRQGLTPLIVPITLLKHHIGRLPVPDWVHQQVYLNPYPKELMLRNRV